MKKTITFSILIFAALTLCSCSDSENSSENEKNAPQKEDQNVTCIINEEEIDFEILLANENKFDNLEIVVENTGCEITTDMTCTMRIYNRQGLRRTKKIDDIHGPWRKNSTKYIAFTVGDDSAFREYGTVIIELTITTPHGSRTKSFHLKDVKTQWR